MAFEQDELSPAEDAIIRTLYELVSNLHGAEVGPIKDHMEARFPWLDPNRVTAEPAAQALNEKSVRIDDGTAHGQEIARLIEE